MTAWVGQRACQPSGPSGSERSYHPVPAVRSPVGFGHPTTCRQVCRAPLAVTPRVRALCSHQQPMPAEETGSAPRAYRQGSRGRRKMSWRIDR